MAVEPKLVWLIGSCDKGGKPDVIDLCSAGYVPVLFRTLSEAQAEIDPRLPVRCIIVLPGCKANPRAFTDAAREAWPGVTVCVATCAENCRAPGMLACALAAATAS